MTIFFLTNWNANVKVLYAASGHHLISWPTFSKLGLLDRWCICQILFCKMITTKSHKHTHPVQAPMITPTKIQTNILTNSFAQARRTIFLSNMVVPADEKGPQLCSEMQVFGRDVIFKTILTICNRHNRTHDRRN